MVSSLIRGPQYNQGFIEGYNDFMYGAAARYYEDHDMAFVVERVFGYSGMPVQTKDIKYAWGYTDGYSLANYDMNGATVSI